ncbi:MAG: ABC transporter permease [Methanomicrobiales archaeon]|nr:ABC transporter permease [Methanomicrobiales archaeon]
MTGTRLRPFELAWRNIRLHRLQSLLAMVGIIIGVTAISTVGMLGSGLSLSVSDSLALAGDTIVITPRIGAAPVATGEMAPGLGITERQVGEIRRAAGSNTVIPLHTGAGRITVGDQVMTVAIYGMEPADIPALLEKESGSYLRYSPGAMAGARLAGENGISVGETLGIGTGEERLKIVGILAARGTGLDISPDQALIVPDTWFTSRFGERDYDEVIIRVKNPEDIDGVKAAVEDQLNPRERVVNVMDTRRVLPTLLDSFNRVSAALMTVGGISLAVAGISLLNAMLLSVSGGTREMGILRSLGATRGEVMKAFLSEALILGLLGSAIGGVLSLAGGSLALGAMLQTPDYLLAPATLIPILTGMAFGTGVSLLSGIYPAWRAGTLYAAGPPPSG